MLPLRFGRDHRILGGLGQPKLTVVLALILITSPVAGLRSIRAARWAFTSLPSPGDERHKPNRGTPAQQLIQDPPPRSGPAVALFQPHTCLNMMDLSKSDSFGHRGKLFLTQWGTLAPLNSIRVSSRLPISLLRSPARSTFTTIYCRRSCSNSVRFPSFTDPKSKCFLITRRWASSVLRALPAPGRQGANLPVQQRLFHRKLFHPSFGC